jgi:hypothetical protein
MRSPTFQRSVLPPSSGLRSSGGVRDFSSTLCVQTGSGAHAASCTVGTGGKAGPGREADHSPPSSAEVKKEQELYLLSPQALLWRVVGQFYLVLPGCIAGANRVLCRTEWARLKRPWQRVSALPAIKTASEKKYFVGQTSVSSTELTRNKPVRLTAEVKIKLFLVHYTLPHYASVCGCGGGVQV